MFFSELIKLLTNKIKFVKKLKNLATLILWKVSTEQ